MQLSKEILNNLFEYCDGELFYKINRSRNKAGSKAGTYRSCDNAYQVIINRKHYLVHRIVFMMHNGYMPKFVDHKDCNRANNRIENLREATHCQNAQNARTRKDSSSGVKGVNKCKITGLWRVRVQAQGKRVDIGNFEDIELAELAVQMAREKYHGQFANHGHMEQLA